MDNYGDMNGGLDPDIIKISPESHVLIITKVNDGKEYVDVRKWHKYPNLDNFIPTKKGLMFNKLTQWPIIMEHLKNYLAKDSTI